VVVTHELDSAFKIADQITVLDRGEILVTDSVSGIRQSDNERVRALINRTPNNAHIDVDEYLQRLTRVE
jgi:phospholipid/cholesterol/gamma-HCH transport system ATP-binding protein